MIDVEAELMKLLQDAIWDELEIETGQSKEDYDKQIVEQLVKNFKEQ